MPNEHSIDHVCSARDPRHRRQAVHLEKGDTCLPLWNWQSTPNARPRRRHPSFRSRCADPASVLPIAKKTGGVREPRGIRRPVIPMPRLSTREAKCTKKFPPGHRLRERCRRRRRNGLRLLRKDRDEATKKRVAEMGSIRQRARAPSIHSARIFRPCWRLAEHSGKIGADALLAGEADERRGAR